MSGHQGRIGFRAVEARLAVEDLHVAQEQVPLAPPELHGNESGRCESKHPGERQIPGHAGSVFRGRAAGGELLATLRAAFSQGEEHRRDASEETNCNQHNGERAVVAEERQHPAHAEQRSNGSR